MVKSTLGILPVNRFLCVGSTCKGQRLLQPLLLAGGPPGGLPRQSLGAGSPSLHTANSFGFHQVKFPVVFPDFRVRGFSHPTSYNLFITAACCFRALLSQLPNT